MFNNSLATISDFIRAAATAKGFADSSIVTQSVKEKPGVLDVGSWFVLSVKRQSDDDWELLGRRRTEAELLVVIQRQ